MLQDSIIGFLAAGIAMTVIVVGFMWVGSSWFLQWLKGTAGMLLLVFAVMGGFVIQDVLTYNQASDELPVVTVSVIEIGDQFYDLTLVTTEGRETRYQIRGDQWQLDFRIMSWNGPIASLASNPMYRLDRLSGRYYSLEQERNAERTVFALDKSDWIDTWAFLNTKSFWLDADFGSAVFMPMIDGAVFTVFVTADGVKARPLNDIAREALGGDW